MAKPKPGDPDYKHVPGQLDLEEVIAEVEQAQFTEQDVIDQPIDEPLGKPKTFKESVAASVARKLGGTDAGTDQGK